jgi:cytidylate kinase
MNGSRKRLVITIDGPAGSGKSTTAWRVAQALGYVYLDSGAMYRAVTLDVLNHHIPVDDLKAVSALAESAVIDFKTAENGQLVFLNGSDVTDLIRTPQVTAAIGPVAANPRVRAALVPIQKALGKKGGLVAEGRDMGSVVFPDADLKIFLSASLPTRANRRFQENRAKDLHVDIQEIMRTIAKRDDDDRERECSPLTIAPDAMTIDTTDLTIDQQVQRVLQEARKRGA